VPQHARPLLERDVAPNPFDQFGTWFAEAADAVRVPEAMALATSGPDCRPSLRMVLMKSWDERGFVFFTQYGSRKADELESNPRAGLLFHWDELGRQVRLEGRVDRVSAADSDAYFATRPFGARIAALASHQSEPVASRDELDRRFRQLADAHGDGDVPRPESWGGYRLGPEVFEFWQNRDDRLHDRLRYRLVEGAWQLERLQP
jgi:pyridoxamine 5'-phosphate oxidase